MDIIHRCCLEADNYASSAVAAAEAAETSFDGQTQETLTQALSLKRAPIMRWYLAKSAIAATAAPHHVARTGVR